MNNPNEFKVKNKKTYRMKIGIDLDGVVYDIISSFDEFLISKGIIPNKKEYDRGIEKERIKKHFEEFSKVRPFLKIPLIDKARETINNLSRKNEIYIITHREWCENGIKDTLSRLKKDKIKFNKIYFTKRKGEEAKKYNLDFFIEDNLTNARYIRELSNAKVFLIDAPYNQSKKEKGIHRIKNISEVTELIKNKIA